MVAIHLRRVQALDFSRRVISVGSRAPMQQPG